MSLSYRSKSSTISHMQLQNIHGDGMYSIGIIVNNIVITMYGARWVLELSVRSRSKFYKCLITMLKLI